MINTLAQVKKHLRLSSLDTSEDDLLLLYMGAAEDHILNYIDAEQLPGLSDSPPSSVPFAVQAAHLLLVGGLYETAKARTRAGRLNRF